MTLDQALVLTLSLAAMLLMALISGTLARRLGQPAILGELLGGIILGPTILGAWHPSLFSTLFPTTGPAFSGRDWLVKSSLLCFIFMAGMEVDLSHLKRRGLAVVTTSFCGILIPFALGFGAVWFFPALWGEAVRHPSQPLALFMGVALSISALPVIARILTDLRLLQSELGTVILSAAVIDDLVGWTLFGLIVNQSIPHHASGWAHTVVGIFLLGVVVSAFFRKAELYFHKKFYPVITAFVSLYFISIGLKANFIQHFDPVLVTVVFVIACAGKIVGVGLAAWAGGMPVKDAFAVGFGMNARGAMEMILASVALEYHLIDEQIFIALVLMALATSLLSGPAIKKLTSSSVGQV